MKILAVDTATKDCSVAVIDANSILAESTSTIDLTHSRLLLNLIDTVLEKAGLKPAHLDGFAVTVGPGSFTGLRIGIASIKGLAYSLAKPLVGVSSLETLAFQCRQTPLLICPLLDARKQEVYYCHYRFDGGKLARKIQESVGSPADVVREIREPCLFVGNGATLYQELISAELGKTALFADKNQHSIQASTVARLSLQRLSRRESDDVALLVPNYIRQSDAELKLKSAKVIP